MDEVELEGGSPAPAEMSNGDSEHFFKWTNVCRLCLSPDVELDIFVSDDSDILKKIKTCLNMLIYEGDPMPKKLCITCWKQLESWSTFRAKCTETEESLRMKLTEYTKFESVDDYLKKFANFRKSAEHQSDIEKSPEVHSATSEEQENPSTNGTMDSPHATTGQTSRDTILEPADSTNNVDRPIKLEVTRKSYESWNGDGVISSVEGDASEIWNSSHAENIQVKQEPICGLCPHCHKDVASESNHICIASITASSVDEEPVVDAMVTDDDENSLYNLRSRLDTTNVNYEELEDWVEEEIDSQVSPLGPSSFPTPEIQAVEEPPQSPPKQIKFSPFKCTMCKVYFSSRSALHFHYNSADCLGQAEDKHNCRVCGRKFLSVADLADHQGSHLFVAHHLTVDDLLSCDQCDSKFSDMFVLKDHAIRHQQNLIKPPRKFSCSKCNLIFQKRGEYDKHRRTHAPTVPPITAFRCTLCGQVFREEEVFFDHRFAYHGLPDERVVCQTCGVKFPDLKALATHALGHRPGPVAKKTTTHVPKFLPQKPKIEPSEGDSGQSAVERKPIRCRRCGKLFKSPEDLRYHELTSHKNPSPHHCRKCSRRFATRSQLLFHYRSHFSQTNANAEPAETIEDDEPEEEPIIEPESDITEIEPELIAHLRCVICDIQFLNNDDHALHNITHKYSLVRKHVVKNVFKPGKKMIYRYQCNKCPQLFCTRGSLNRHRESAHPGEEIDFIRLRRGIIAKKNDVYYCQHCDEQFLSKGKRNIHVKQVHQVAVEEGIEPEDESKLETTGCVRCQFCHKLFNYYYIARHIRREHRVKEDNTNKVGYKCRYCAKICSNSFNLKKHESCHDPQRKHHFLCKVCGSGYANYAVYHRHKKACTAPKNEVLAAAAAATASLMAPLQQPPPSPKRVTPPRPPPPEPPALSFDDYKICPICLNSYETTSLLELHVMTAHGVEAFKGLEMAQPKKVAQMGEPIPHGGVLELWHEEANRIIRIVDGAYRCTCCHIHLSNAMAAMYHRTQHPRGNLYIVQVDTNAFQCTVCPHLFRTRQEAMYHAEQHAEPKDVKPPALHPPPMAHDFKCPFCSSTFTCEESIRSHIYYVHPEGMNNTN